MLSCFLSFPSNRLLLQHFLVLVPLILEQCQTLYTLFFLSVRLPIQKSKLLSCNLSRYVLSKEWGSHRDVKSITQLYILAIKTLLKIPSNHAHISSKNIYIYIVTWSKLYGASHFRLNLIRSLILDIISNSLHLRHKCSTSLEVKNWVFTAIS